jgi:hypothetical protein
MEQIMCSAIWIDDGKDYVHSPHNKPLGLTICGYRHCDCIVIMNLLYEKYKYNYIQGFLTNKKRFVDRIEAMKIAKGCNQLININTTSEELCSEDVWLSK